MLRTFKFSTQVVNLPDGMRSLKLGDFGLAEETHQLLYTVCGTPTYVAPEILLETGYWLKVDVWAMGMASNHKYYLHS